MGIIFNPIRPPFHGDETNEYLNEVDNYVDELWLQKRFEEVLEREKTDASS